MATVTYYVVQTFVLDEAGNVVAGETIPTQSEGAARTLAISLARDVAGVIAFSRTGDPDIGEYSEPTIIHKAGQVPDEIE